MPSALDDYMFDLQGFLILRNAVSPELVASLHSVIENLPSVEYGEWIGYSQRRDYTKDTGLELHQCLELGAPFEELIDHPGWINHTRHYCGEEKSYVQGLYIDESILSVRRKGGHHPVHSGGFQGAMRGKYDYANGVFRCGQCNIVLALTDIGPGDGATMVVPGTHKSNFDHPLRGDYAKGDRMDNLPGAIEVHLNKGDALLFVDGLMHGGSSRTNPHGERRVVILRYGPVWGASRFGYTYSPELIGRLSPERKAIIQPVEPLLPGMAPVKNF